MAVIALVVPASAGAAKVPEHPDRAQVAKICGSKPAPAACTTAKMRVEADKDATQSFVWVTLLVAIVLFGVLLWGTRLLIGTDGRLSTSKTVAGAWTMLLAAALLAYVLAKLFHHPQAFSRLVHSGLAGQYGLLIGGPLGAAIAAKGIVGAQVARNSGAKRPTHKTDKHKKPRDRNPLLLVQNDDGDAELGAFQYVLFNFVAMVFFVGTAIEHPLGGLPTIPDVLLGLTSVSAAGYVTKKALPGSEPTAKVVPETQEEGKPVTIKGSNLLTYPEPRDTPITVLFGGVSAYTSLDGRARTFDGVDEIKVEVPAGLPPDKAVDVFVLTPAPARVAAGTFTLKTQ